MPTPPPSPPNASFPSTKEDTTSTTTTSSATMATSTTRWNATSGRGTIRNIASSVTRMHPTQGTTQHPVLADAPRPPPSNHDEETNHDNNPPRPRLTVEYVAVTDPTAGGRLYSLRPEYANIPIIAIPTPPEEEEEEE